jgi:hypothetical protein
MQLSEQMEWARQRYLDAASKCHEAERYWKAMKEHSKNMTLLWEILKNLTDSCDNGEMRREDAEDEVEECLKAMQIVQEAMVRLEGKQRIELEDIE